MLLKRANVTLTQENIFQTEKVRFKEHGKNKDSEAMIKIDLSQFCKQI